MKIRNGFVSNSSSSSFMIIGTSNSVIIDNIIKSKKMTREEIIGDINFGQFDSGDLLFIGDGYDLYHVGMELSETEMDKMPLLIHKQRLSKMLKEKYNVDISIDHIGLFYGESSSG